MWLMFNVRSCTLLLPSPRYFYYLTEHYICIIYYLPMNCDSFILFFSSQALHFPYRIPATRRKPRKRQSPKLRYTHFVNISGIWFYYIEKWQWQWQWLRIHEYDYYNWLSWGCWNVMKLFSCIIYCECDLSVSLIAMRWIVGLRSHFFHNEICNSFMECNLYERILMFTND